jgi:hypothetical protein
MSNPDDEETVSKTSDTSSTLTQLIILEDFTAYCCCESFKSYTHFQKLTDISASSQKKKDQYQTSHSRDVVLITTY